MFQIPTVFILGAGASWHYGYPTGDDLIKAIREEAEGLLSVLDDFYKKVQVSTLEYSEAYCPRYILDKMERQDVQAFKSAILDTKNECKNLIDRVDIVDPLVIDHFLNYNSDLQSITKLFISRVILKCQADNVTQKMQRDRGNWCRFILHHLMIGCESPHEFISGNDVAFVTFNYDISLEENLLQGLKKNHFFSDTDVVEEFLSSQRVIHVYGKVGKSLISNRSDISISNPIVYRLFSLKPELDAAYDSSKELLTIAPNDKLENKVSLEAAKKAIERAERVYILGYGFDKMNNENIGLDKLLYRKEIRGRPEVYRTGPKKPIYFTNYKSKNLVSKSASQLFYRTPDRFLPPNTFISSDISDGTYYEMSIKDVYEALSDDFEFVG
ncbi:MAG TPA: hypothetical protein DEA55_02695 [Rhodospirillaceae bacterium]|nr:hypothetical protein [Rhodospirillaceae bacterium]